MHVFDAYAGGERLRGESVFGVSRVGEHRLPGQLILPAHQGGEHVSPSVEAACPASGSIDHQALSIGEAQEKGVHAPGVGQKQRGALRP